MIAFWGNLSRIIPMKIFHFRECDSTQTIARHLAQNSEGDMTVVVADTQTKGVGRQGRVWTSNEGGLWMSVVLKREIPIGKVSFLALSVGIEIHDVLKEMGVDTIIKYPNDILAAIDGEAKKLCGILCQSAICAGKLDHIIVGVGMNVSNQPPPEGTSLLHLSGKKLEVGSVMRKVANAIDKSTLRVINNDCKTILDELEALGCIQLPS